MAEAEAAEAPTEETNAPILGRLDIAEIVVTEDGLLHDGILDLIKDQVRRSGIREAKVRISGDSKNCPHNLSFLAHVHVEGYLRHVGTITLHWMVKSIPNIPFIRTQVNIKAMYEREAYMYKDLFPRLKEMENANHIFNGFSNFPAFVFSSSEEHKQTIVTMDVKGTNFIHKQDNDEPWDMKHVKVVLKALARYHAFFYVLKQKFSYDWCRVIENTQINLHSWEDHGTVEAKRYEEVLVKRLHRCLDPDQDAGALVKLKLFTGNLMKIMQSTYDLKTTHSVVIHGDCWMNNILFKYGHPTKSYLPTEACLVDWQHARHSSPACDLTTLIYCSTERYVRDKHYERMLRLYHYHLCAQITEMEGDAEKVPYADLKAEIKRYAIVGLYKAATNLHFIMSSKNEIPKWWECESPLQVVAKMDYPIVDDDVYRTRMREIILEYAERGYFDFITEK